MRIHINDMPCEAQPGDILLDVAKQNKCHIGYICGGSGVCQSCFVYVQEGMDHLSERSDVEKAFISDKLTDAGGRLACQTRIIKDGPVRILSRAEMFRRIVLGLKVTDFVTYAQTIGYNVVNQLPSGIGNIFSRVREGKLNPVTSIQNIGKGLGPAAQLIGKNVFDTFPFLQAPVNMAGAGATGLLEGASSTLCNVSGGKLHLPGTTCKSCEDDTPVERVHIKASSSKK
ncbi:MULTISPECIES: 2Fe-2S iron-sulfur cluster-binding protein [Prosthecochloris]|uniref:Chlorosome protein J n=1 Tax=Prosthecochloris marina TaxID=2017681 RepID=A0A317T3W8_9CHLB|nr:MULTISPECIES: 2Fe-2S iron-sulfur cluster-binding protein [Prosthecochloris]PWW81358.1 chlorosome protein J [Prosthecochloris marina]UZJ38379.1 (2Fe-2S)-binding protein [Prosthecochloris sp. SCSIO W1103]